MFDLSGATLVTTSHSDWEARAWDLASGHELWHYACSGGNPWSLGASFTDDAKLVLLDIDGIVLDAETGELLTRLSEEDHAVGPSFDCNGTYAWYPEDGDCLLSRVDGSEPVRRVLLTTP